MALIPNVGRKKWRIRMLVIGIILILWMGVALHLIPIWWMSITSIKPFSEVYVMPPPLFPKNPTLIAYKTIFAGIFTKWKAGGFAGVPSFMNKPIWIYLKNSFVMAGGIMIFQILITGLVGYSLSKLCSPRWERIMFLFFIATMFVPFQVYIIPQYLILKSFPFAGKDIPSIPFTNMPFPSVNLLNTYWSVILPSAYSGFNVLLFKGFFDTLPDEIINAARLDGSSELGIFRRIILPMAKPVFAVVAYFSFNGAWNAFLWPMVALSRAPDLLPLPVVFYSFQEALIKMVPSPDTQEYLEQGLGINALMAIAVIQSIPCFIMFLIVREYLMKGVRLRGFK